MGCISSKPAGNYLENMLRKAIIYTKAKYKTLESEVSKTEQNLDMLALDEFGLFISGTLNHGQRQMTIDKQPLYGKEVVEVSPKSLGHYKQLMYMYYGYPLSCACIDICFKEKVSQQLIISTIYALNTVDICRSLNLSNEDIDTRVSQLLAAWLAKCINLEFLSLVGCHLEASEMNELADGLVRVFRNRQKITEVGRCEDISINDQEAYMYDIPTYSPVMPGLFGLDLSRNKLGDQAVKRILESLTEHSELHFLGFAQCELTNSIIEVICEQLKNWNNLMAVDLSDNGKINDQGVEYLTKYLKKCESFNLSYIFLEGTKATAKSINKLNNILCRNNICSEVFTDLLEGAYTRLFNAGEMAGECSGEGSDSYIEYATSDFCPVITNPEEQLMVQKLFEKISIEEGYLSHITRILRETPKTSRKLTELYDFTISVSETIGKRPEMEDVISIEHDFLKFRSARMDIVEEETDHFEILICLFDGHGGAETSSAMGILFPAVFADTLNAILCATGLHNACDLPTRIWEPIMFSVFERCDDTLRLRKYPSGCTGVVCFVLDSMIICADVGDSRAILVREESVIGRSNSSQSSRQDSIEFETKGDRMPPSQLQNTSEEMLTNNELANTSEGETNNVESPRLAGEVIEQTDKVLEKPSAQPEECVLNLPVPEQDFSEYFENQEYQETINTWTNVNDIVVRLSKDHKPDLPEEKRRIESVGGYVHGGRVLSTLAVARGFGDFNYKPSVSCSPFLNVYPLQKKDGWLIICCDGVWDVLSDLDVAFLCHRCMTAGHAAIKIRDEAYRLDSGDNISSIAVRLFLKE